MCSTHRRSAAPPALSISAPCTSPGGSGRAHCACGALKRAGRAVILLVIAVGASSGLADQAAAQASMTVAPGADLRIDSSEKPLVDRSGSIKGKVTADQLGPPPAIHRLMYKAPVDVKADLIETIRYEKDGSSREVPVRVAKPIDGVGPSPQGGTDGNFAAAFTVLIQLFLVAVLLEQALSVIFNWRPFLQNFDARGVKTIVSVLVAWFVVDRFALDFVKDLVNVYAVDKIPSEFPTRFLSALILAGGSSGVNNLLVSLGFRSMRSAEQIAPKPPPKEAWIAVRLVRDKAVGPVVASIGPEGTTLPVAGMIEGSSRKNGLLRYFLVDRGRFPVVGGHSLTPEDGKRYVVQLDGFDEKGAPLGAAKWGPYAIAPGAIIDLDIRL